MLKFAYHFSRRLMGSQTQERLRPIMRLAVVGISICLVIIILSLAITTGYRQAIEQKVIDMGSHIRISNYDLNYTFDAKPLIIDDAWVQSLRSHRDIAVVQRFANKVGIVKTADQVEGVVFKGVDTTFSQHYFQRNMLEGAFLHVADTQPSNEVVISLALSKKLHLQVGDNLYAYFVQDPPKQRKFTVSGVYETGLPENDEKFIFADLRHVQKLNGWDANQIGGLEVLIYNYDDLDAVAQYVDSQLGYRVKAETIKQLYPAIFEWTALFDTNVAVLLTITLLICVVSLISTFFIIILEQTTTIGILKTMGLSEGRVHQVFMVLGARIVLRGMVIGNAVGILFCLLQQHFHLIKLDAASYYVSYVPVSIGVGTLLCVNVALFVICLLALLLPAAYVSRRVSIITAIRFD